MKPYFIIYGDQTIKFVGYATDDIEAWHLYCTDKHAPVCVDGLYKLITNCTEALNNIPSP